MANYDANVPPTITLTKTLFAAAATTSTKASSTSSTVSTSTSTSQGMKESPRLHLSASPRVGVVANGDGTDGNKIVTSTRMSTIFNTLTVTSTSTVSTSSSSASSQTSTDSTTESTSTTKNAATATGTFPADDSHSAQSGKVAGSIIGTFAALGMIVFLLWYFCMKKKGKNKLKVSMSLRRRKSSTPKTPQLEEQKMEETRTMMLKRSAELNKSKENIVNTFLSTSNDHIKPMSPRSVAPEAPRRLPAGRPSMIGVAVTSSTPPNTPPLPRSNSQRNTAIRKGFPPSTDPSGSHPMSLMPGPYIPGRPSFSELSGSSRVIRKPAPIVTAYAAAPNSRSQLSPKAVFNAIGNSTNKAWRRASQALSPSAYQRLPPDNHSIFQTPRRRDSEKPRNEELEIGAQTDKGWL